MIKKTQIFSLSTSLSIIAVCLIVFISSCKKENILVDEDSMVIPDELSDQSTLKCGGHGQGQLVDYSLVNTMSAAQIKVILGPSFEALIKYGVDMYKVGYLTRYNGNILKVSGVVGIPDMPIDHTTPIVMYNHGTRVTEADNVPSSGLDLMSVAAAANGKICFAADYVGYGDSKQIFTPYMVNSATVYPICDMVLAGRQFLHQNYAIHPKPSITMFGFSQGGSSTMAAQKEIENNPFYRKIVHLKGVAMGTGPYDLNDHTMLPIISGDSYSAPVLMVFIFISYNTYYNLNMDLDELFKSSYGQLFLDLVAQNKPYAVINQALPVNISELLQDDFRTAFLAGETPFNRLFGLNSTYKGWIPKSPTRIYHSTSDEIVPYANAEIAYNTFIAAGAKSVGLIRYEQINHVTTAFLSFADILSWVDSQQ